MDQIVRMFAETFARWDVTLPPENLRQRSAGHIEKGGWLIQFSFGQDGKGEYLDYYASHRMTGDDHVRLYADGTKTELAALWSAHLTSTDPVEAKRLEEEFVERNRKISEELVTKGFNLSTINMGLSAGILGADKK